MTVTCKQCNASRKKLPKSWASSGDTEIYCNTCWEQFRCTRCGLSDAKGLFRGGRWICRACGHGQHVQFASGDNLEECHRLIIQDAEAPSTQVAALPICGEDDNAEEEWDDVAPLQCSSWTGSRLTEHPAHVVLLLDVSGSMRTVDVEAENGAWVTRLDAVLHCALGFLEERARLRPRDRFSLVTFGETAEAIVTVASFAGAKTALEGLALRGAQGTFYKPALQMARRLLNKDVGPGHIVLLSDGRPADTKAALEYFQAQLLKGESTQLHGIGFGDTVHSFAPLQQLACLSGGAFALSGSSMRGLCEAFASVSSTITSLSSGPRRAPEVRRAPRPVDFELPGIGDFGKRGVLRFSAKRWTLRYDGERFQEQAWPAAPVECRVKPHMRGGMRLVFGFRDPKVVAHAGSWLVAKFSRFLDAGLGSRGVVESHLRSTAVARHLAASFNARLRDSGRPELFFVPCFLYERLDALSDEPSCFSAERYLPGVFLKYTSNNGFVCQGSLPHQDVVEAFGHYSFAATDGRLLLADLQGVARHQAVLLTDPQVLSLEGLYGPGDLRGEGMRACLTAHRCGPACRALGLRPLSATALRRLAPSRQRPTPGSRLSAWERLSQGTAGSYEVVPEPSCGSSDFDRVSHYNLTEMGLSEGELRSTPVSTSSWQLLDM